MLRAHANLRGSLKHGPPPGLLTLAPLTMLRSLRAVRVGTRPQAVGTAEATSLTGEPPRNVQSIVGKAATQETNVIIGEPQPVTLRHKGVHDTEAAAAMETAPGLSSQARRSASEAGAFMAQARASWMPAARPRASR